MSSSRNVREAAFERGIDCDIATGENGSSVMVQNTVIASAQHEQTRRIASVHP